MVEQRLDVDELEALCLLGGRNGAQTIDIVVTRDPRRPRGATMKIR
jgi:hypothetical protein